MQFWISKIKKIQGLVLSNNIADEENAKKLRALNNEASDASFAFRFLQDLENVKVILSGMNETDQVIDNLKTFEEHKPLSEVERNVLAEIAESMKKGVPCTGCRYCCKGCPMHIPIPEVFYALNLKLANGQIDEARRAYATAVGASDAGNAADCIACGKCEATCPQHLPIIQRLAEAAEQLA